MSWRRKWQPTPVFLPRKFHGQESGKLQSMKSQRVGHYWATEHRGSVAGTQSPCSKESKLLPWKWSQAQSPNLVRRQKWENSKVDQQKNKMQGRNKNSLGNLILKQRLRMIYSDQILQSPLHQNCSFKSQQWVLGFNMKPHMVKYKDQLSTSFSYIGKSWLSFLPWLQW